MTRSERWEREWMRKLWPYRVMPVTTRFVTYLIVEMFYIYNNMHMFLYKFWSFLLLLFTFFDAAESTNASCGPCRYQTRHILFYLLWNPQTHCWLPSSCLFCCIMHLQCRKQHFPTSCLCLIERLSCIGVDKKALSTFSLRSCSLVTLARSMSSLSAGTIRATACGR